MTTAQMVVGGLPLALVLATIAIVAVSVFAIAAVPVGGRDGAGRPTGPDHAALNTVVSIVSWAMSAVIVVGGLVGVVAMCMADASSVAGDPAPVCPCEVAP